MRASIFTIVVGGLLALSWPAAAPAQAPAAAPEAGASSEEAALLGRTIAEPFAVDPASPNGTAGLLAARRESVAARLDAAQSVPQPREAAGSALAPVTWPRPSMLIPDEDGTLKGILAEATQALFGRACASEAEFHVWADVPGDGIEAFATEIGLAIEAAGYTLNVQPVEGGVYVGADGRGQSLALVVFGVPEEEMLALLMCDATAGGAVQQVAAGGPGPGAAPGQPGGQPSQGGQSGPKAAPAGGPAPPQGAPGEPVPEPAGQAERSLPIVGVCLVLFGLYRLWDHWRSRAPAGAALAGAGWPQVPARIVSSAVKRVSDATGARFVPRVRFAYAYGGRSFVGDRLGPSALAFADESVAEAVSEAYPAGREVLLRVDPKNPAAASLDEGSSAGGPAAATALTRSVWPSLLFILAGAGVLYAAFA